jgi:hypothetical protein
MIWALAVESVKNSIYSHVTPCNLANDYQVREKPASYTIKMMVSVFPLTLVHTFSFEQCHILSEGSLKHY